MSATTIPTFAPAVPRWSGPPRQRTWVRRFAWVGVLAVGVASYLMVLQAMLSTGNPSYFPSLLLIGSITVPVATLVFAAAGGRTVVPTSTAAVVFTAVIGGVIGTVAAGTVEYGTLRNLATVPMLAVGFIEETAKLVVPLLVFLWLRRRDQREGLLIGIASGMGFATLETMGYGFQVLLAAHSIAAVDTTLLVRALLSPAGHIAWTGMTVAMLWRTRTAAHRGWAVAAFLGTFLAAVGLHAAWDSTTSTTVRAVVAGLGLIALLVFVHRAHREPGAPRRWSAFWHRVPDGPGPADLPDVLLAGDLVTQRPAVDVLVDRSGHWAVQPPAAWTADGSAHWAVQPPSTGRTVPVTMPDDGEAR